ncbi:iron uptake transporter deferrochelatase/peroxidase subunit [Mesorhizobium comanense]|uniref:iron uptake transporter deferrochelatase/peroxidase subunit n=1 Tax=Mesorhizobium comanense TaxID=2502215 RepID=UPI0010F7DFD6|nr:iron uptake transporter deferrochelatase/peroxidase subunit [Mesorhizobium comanense]
MSACEKPQGPNAGLTPSRRSVLIGAVAGALAPQMAVAAGAGSVTNAPESDTLDQRRPFHGEHQPGIVTPRPAAGLVAAFDVLAQNRAGLQRLLRTLTERSAFLMAGGTPPALDPKFPAADSGILGPVVTPDNLTITTSFGASLFDERFGLQDLKPRHLTRMASFPNDALKEEFCHGDLLLQFSSNTPDTNIHALRDIVKNTPDSLLLRWKQEGSVPVRQPDPGKPKQSARNFLGFRDGSANPDASDAELMKRIVWVQPGGGEHAWATGGSYQVVRLIRNFVERWDRTPLQEQQTIIGRQKASGAPLEGGEGEADVPHFANDPEGKTTPLDAHIRLANPRDAEAQKHLILRRPFNYSNGVSKSNQMDMGLLFIAYQADLEQGFIAVQNRLNGESLEEYIKPFGGGYFFALPGVKDDQDYLGRALLDMAATHA